MQRLLDGLSQEATLDVWRALKVSLGDHQLGRLIARLHDPLRDSNISSIILHFRGLSGISLKEPPSEDQIAGFGSLLKGALSYYKTADEAAKLLASCPFGEGATTVWLPKHQGQLLSIVLKDQAEGEDMPYIGEVLTTLLTQPEGQGGWARYDIQHKGTAFYNIEHATKITGHAFSRYVDLWSNNDYGGITKYLVAKISGHCLRLYMFSFYFIFFCFFVF